MKDDDDQLELFGAPTPPESNDAKPLKRIVSSELDRLPDVRDGLTREQRVILYTLYEAEKERPGKRVPTAMLYGRVVERIPMSKERFMELLANLVGRGTPSF